MQQGDAGDAFDNLYDSDDISTGMIDEFTARLYDYYSFEM